MPRYTPAQQAEALAVYYSTGNMHEAARKIGCGTTTVSRWVASDIRHENERDESGETNAADVERLADGIRIKQEQVRNLLLDRIIALAPTTEDLRAVATAFGIVTDKALLTQGKPTTIHGEAFALPADATPAQLVSVADELRARRQTVTG